MAALEVEVVSSGSQSLTLSNSLTPKQKLFIKHYLETHNGRQAAELAGYSGDDATLRSVASENLTKPNIRAELTRLFNPIADAEEVLARLTKYSRSSIADVLDDSGAFDIDFAKANHSDDLIKKLKIKRRLIPNGPGKEPDVEITHELEIHDAKDATIQLAKVHRLLTERVEVEDKTPQPAQSLAQLIFEKTGEKLTDEQAERIMAASIQRAKMKIA